MKLDFQDMSVQFDFSPKDYFLTKEKDGWAWALSYRIDMSYKGKDDQVGSVRLFLTDQEYETLKDYFDIYE